MLTILWLHYMILTFTIFVSLVGGFYVITITMWWSESINRKSLFALDVAVVRDSIVTNDVWWWQWVWAERNHPSEWSSCRVPVVATSELLARLRLLYHIPALDWHCSNSAMSLYSAHCQPLRSAHIDKAVTTTLISPIKQSKNILSDNYLRYWKDGRTNRKLLVCMGICLYVY